jgi:hypothetical protein
MVLRGESNVPHLAQVVYYCSGFPSIGERKENEVFAVSTKEILGEEESDGWTENCALKLLPECYDFADGYQGSFRRPPPS